VSNVRDATVGDVRAYIEVSQLVDAAASALFGFAAVPAAMFKYEGFREEDEWRIVVEVAAAAPHASRPPSRARNGRLVMGEGTDPDAGPPCFVDEAKVRVSGAKLVPYFEVQLRRDAKLPLACIVIGPGQDPTSTELAVRILLKEAGYPDGVEIRTSGIPYRP
jgi:hypothetical protein